MDSYYKTISQLFIMLELANRADSDQAEAWQEPCDARAHGSKYFFGNIEAAIRSIAGEDIVEHWAETGEVDHKLANRV